MRVRLVAAIVVALVIAASVRAIAHDIPNAIVVQAFLKPEGERLRFLVRVPLQAMQDVDVPLRGQGYLDLARAGDALRTATTIWIAREVALYEEDTRLGAPELIAVRVSLPSDRSFEEYDIAHAHITGPPLSDDIDLYWEQGILDAWLEYPIASDRSRFAIDPGLRPLAQRVTIALRLLTPDGRVRAFELHDDPGLVLLDPRWGQAAVRFVRSGFAHILDGTDHLLFPAVPGHSDSARTDANRRGHIVYRRAFDNADRVRVRFGAGRPVVSAVGRNADCGVDRLHGARKHRGRRPHAPLAHHLRLRARARLRVFVRSPRFAAVRRIASADVAAVVQPRCRARTARRPWQRWCRCCTSCSGSSSPNAWERSSCRPSSPIPHGTG